MWETTSLSTTLVLSCLLHRCGLVLVRAEDVGLRGLHRALHPAAAADRRDAQEGLDVSARPRARGARGRARARRQARGRRDAEHLRSRFSGACSVPGPPSRAGLRRGLRRLASPPTCRRLRQADGCVRLAESGPPLTAVAHPRPSLPRPPPARPPRCPPSPAPNAPRSFNFAAASAKKSRAEQTQWSPTNVGFQGHRLFPGIVVEK